MKSLFLKSLLCCIVFVQCSQYVFGQDTLFINAKTNPIQRLTKFKVCVNNQDSSAQNCEVHLQPFLNTLDIPNGQVCEIQSELYFPENHQNKFLALKIQGLRGAQEIYWDQKLIGQSGVLASDSIPSKMGKYANYGFIPANLATEGKHTLKIRYKQFYQSSYGLISVQLGDYLVFQYWEQYINHQMILMFAIFLISGMFFLIFYFGFGLRTSFLFLSLYCFTYAIKSTLKPYQGFFNPEFIIPYLSYENAHLAANLGSIFLIAFLLWEMLVPWKVIFLLLFSLISVSSYFLITEVYFLMILIVCSLTIIAFAFYYKREGVWWVFVGLIGYAFFANLWYQQLLSYGYFAGIIFFIICMTVSVGQKVARQIKLRQAALLRSSTLENQLLKKSIQPHFILNSLTSLQELIDQNPEGASDFVDQLAEEFKLLSKVSDQKLIPIEDELNMCRIHLKIMEYRKNSSFTLKTEGLNGQEMIPPGVFHTLIENGITHGYGTKHHGCFILKKIQQNGHIEYTFFNDGEIESDSEEIQTKGTGLKYIEARLRETYQSYWSLESQKVQNGWEVKISIQNSVKNL